MKNDWEIKKLGEVCEINIGRTPERGNFKMWDKEKKTENVWLSIADLNNTENGYISDSTEYVSDNAVPKMKLVKANTLLMSFKLTIGRCAITKRDLFTNEAIAALPILDKNLDLFFLKYYLENFDWAKLTEGDVKVKGKTLNKEKLKEVPITLPPLEEQKRIVKILDEKIAMLETVKANAKANLQNAKDLFQSQLTKAFSNTTWEKKRLGDCTSIIGDGLHGTPKYDENGNYYFINGSNLTITDIVFTPETKRVNETEYQKYKVELNENTVFLSINGSTLGKRTAFYNNEPVILGKSACYINVKSNTLNKYFLRHFLNSDIFQEYAWKEKTGAAIPNLGLKAMRDLKIPLPPLSEQKRIVEQLDSLSEKTKALQDIYKKILLDCDELKQAFLQKAFEGEL
ncbi:MAG: restriction endonuclease subunit S [Treponema sp.]|nr:restriction endonuclease subunit S [Treponema sp.]